MAYWTDQLDPVRVARRYGLPHVVDYCPSTSPDLRKQMGQPESVLSHLLPVIRRWSVLGGWTLDVGTAPAPGLG